MAVSVTKSSGKYFYDHQRVWLESYQTGVAPFYVGNWGKQLGTSPLPTPSEVRGLCDGTHLPAGRKPRIGGFDITISFGKSVSFLAYGLTPQSGWKSWTELFIQAAGPEVKALVGDQVLRTGAQGKTREASQGGAVLFAHSQSFLGQPNAHLHAFVPNLTCAAGGGRGAIGNAREMFLDQGVINARINKRLDDQLQERGFETIRVGKSVELARMPKELLAEISPARAAMDEALREHGFSGPKACDFYARQARRDGGHRVDRTPEEMGRACRAIAERYGVTVESLKRQDKALPPSQDAVRSRATAYDVAMEAMEACAEKFGKFTARQFQEQLVTRGIGRPTTLRDLDAVGVMFLERPRYAGMHREADPGGRARYSTRETKAQEAQVERGFVRDAWDELASAGKKLGKAVLIATARSAAGVIERVRDAVSPPPQLVPVDAQALAAFNRAHRPTQYLLAHAKALAIGLISPGTPHERAGVAEQVFASLRHHERLPRNAIVVVERSALADLRDLRLLARIANRDGAAVVLADRPEERRERRQEHRERPHHEQSRSI